MKPPHLVHGGYVCSTTASSHPEPVRPIYYYEYEGEKMYIFEAWMRLKEFMGCLNENVPTFEIPPKRVIEIMEQYEKAMPEYYTFNLERYEEMKNDRE